ncbi:hypothetical protein CPB86DRAFT_830250 [Serendipita vermifera]|nr:hypothetical protein CPB86DRAFT_830250 [Serendipita vermifera]
MIYNPAIFPPRYTSKVYGKKKEKLARQVGGQHDRVGRDQLQTCWDPELLTRTMHSPSFPSDLLLCKSRSNFYGLLVQSKTIIVGDKLEVTASFHLLIHPIPVEFGADLNVFSCLSQPGVGRRTESELWSNVNKRRHTPTHHHILGTPGKKSARISIVLGSLIPLLSIKLKTKTSHGLSFVTCATFSQSTSIYTDTTLMCSRLIEYNQNGILCTLEIVSKVQAFVFTSDSPRLPYSYIELKASLKVSFVEAFVSK